MASEPSGCPNRPCPGPHSSPLRLGTGVTPRRGTWVFPSLPCLCPGRAPRFQGLRREAGQELGGQRPGWAAPAHAASARGAFPSPTRAAVSAPRPPQPAVRVGVSSSELLQTENDHNARESPCAPRRGLLEGRRGEALAPLPPPALVVGCSLTEERTKGRAVGRGPWVCPEPTSAARGEPELPWQPSPPPRSHPRDSRRAD